MGIGTVTPDVDNRPGLHIHSNHNDSCRLNLTTPTNDNTRIGYFGLNRFGIDACYGFQIRDSKDSYATRLLIDSTGKMGLGTTPSEQFHLLKSHNGHTRMVVQNNWGSNATAQLKLISPTDEFALVKYASGDAALDLSNLNMNSGTCTHPVMLVELAVGGNGNVLGNGAVVCAIS